MKAPRKAGIVGLVAAGALGGAVLAGTVSASAATGTSGTASSSTSSSSAATAPGYGTAAPGTMRGPGGGSPVRSDETLVTGSTLTTLKAAALKAVPGGTVIRVETDAGDATYEAHMTKADGSLVTVKFDKNLAVTAVEDGMGKGDPAQSGQAPSGQAPSSTTG